MKWCLQIRKAHGWETVSEHNTDQEAREAWPKGYYGHINQFRIVEKRLKPRANCRTCKGTGKVEVYGSRDPDPAICPCPECFAWKLGV